jgi:drug/metabolite transporter (DMT)-like permease
MADLSRRHTAAILGAVIGLAVIGLGLVVIAAQTVAAGVDPQPSRGPWLAGVLAMLSLGIPAVIAARLVRRRSPVGRRLGLLVAVISVVSAALVLIATQSRAARLPDAELMRQAAPWLGLMLVAAGVFAALLFTRESFPERLD